jgi:hypothetical protein
VAGRGGLPDVRRRSAAPSFPAFLSKRDFDFRRFRRFTARLRPALVATESVTRPRWNAHRDATDRLVGGLVFVLALTAMWPLPLVNVIPESRRVPAGRRRAAAGGGRPRDRVDFELRMDGLGVRRGHMRWMA